MSVEFQLKLEPPKRETPQLDLFPANEEIPIHLLMDASPDQELARWRRRALFLTSVFLHIFLILFIIFAPDLIRRGKLMMGIPVRPQTGTSNHNVILTSGFAEVVAKSASGSTPLRQESDGARESTGH